MPTGRAHLSFRQTPLSRILLVQAQPHTLSRSRHTGTEAGQGQRHWSGL
jgi:hypothetical protein